MLVAERPQQYDPAALGNARDILKRPRGLFADDAFEMDLLAVAGGLQL
ncbi:hypothetical protein [Bradyrhizobium icense]|nr:hypothetical protein [Bradyrhizobium icense]